MPGSESKSEPSNVLADFEKVVKAERVAIRKRRGENEQDPEACEEITDLVGLALSGGGVRSASFCLGALQALGANDLVKRIDYLSTVSGGGYIGASMIAAMTRGAKEVPSEVKFPFLAIAPDDYKDSPQLRHIRDHSRYLMPHGFNDVLKSTGVLLRGLVVNIILVLAVILPLATMVILANPTVDHLKYSFAADIWLDWVSSDPNAAVYELLHQRFLVTKITLITGFFLLSLWGVVRSYREITGSRSKHAKPDYRGFGASLTKFGVVSLLLAFIAESQTYAIEKWIVVFGSPDFSWGAELSTVSASIAAAASAVVAFRQQLASVIANATDSPTIGAMFKVILAKLVIVLAAFVMPFALYVAFIGIAASGIATNSLPSNYGPTEQYPLLPNMFLSGERFLFIGFVLSFFAWLIYASWRARGSWDFIKASSKKIREEKGATARKLAYFFALFGTLYLAMIATRDNPAGQQQYWDALRCFAWISGITIFVSLTFSENANTLHGLYRDRLNTAFALGPNKPGEAKDRKKEAQSLALSELETDVAPLLLINATLNATRYSDKEYDEDEIKRDAFDPAKRGRRAEFFQFSKTHIGSDATGYVCPGQYDQSNRKVDLATAVAISGAAVSSNSGRVGTPLLSPTLALLNLRLGYWLDNPNSIAGEYNVPKWTEIFSLYLLQEAFGLLRTSSRKLLLSDGGHIDNIGLYQLLKRRCKVIIVIDSEADPAMNFGALADAQRFARIDLGHRIDIDWMPIRASARNRSANRTESVSKSDPSHGNHFAIGKILYSGPNSAVKDGVLLYIKANVTGDEADYVLDYERRYPNFPHESTADQFFSEEQMEVYRALGFHSVSRALEELRNTESRTHDELKEMLREHLRL
ncbi:patatin-like phospholipase family protein [Hoeflea alexandrii]|uniref:patatin-like phospholipase family protein n=1 Tax=Hoeflea alexandrii TaxID=288436 RepID=UPI0022AE703A|nr:patatin-like phospholipase family protein [Hoeflea alexandrii]MCZ4291144.1 patatin-like phospholipase family protein [Hoeflea alexandrii]